MSATDSWIEALNLQFYNDVFIVLQYELRKFTFKNKISEKCRQNGALITLDDYCVDGIAYCLLSPVVFLLYVTSVYIIWMLRFFWFFLDRPFGSMDQNFTG
uniref:Uncharacterized protein n=1 Tax=Romanomermis culicivorax TaxID=13658 RepID=A0A915K0X0_ROMCU